MENKNIPVTMDENEKNFFKDLLKNTPDDFKMVEWGSGGSTLMFIEYFSGNRKLISIEHNPDWFDKVNEAVKNEKNIDNFDYYFIPPLVKLDFYGYGIPNEENPCFNEEYICPEIFDDIKIYDADIFLVDGISRGAVLATIYAKAQRRNSCRIFLHDYRGRENWYNWVGNIYKGGIEIITNTLAEFKLN